VKPNKLSLANALANLSAQGNSGHHTLEEVRQAPVAGGDSAMASIYLTLIIAQKINIE
jgi:ribosomal 50S subunit-associated protein YjgA (DUF615 family)